MKSLSEHLSEIQARVDAATPSRSMALDSGGLIKLLYARIYELETDNQKLLAVIRKQIEQRDGLISDLTDYWPNQKSQQAKFDDELSAILEGAK